MRPECPPRARSGRATSSREDCFIPRHRPWRGVNIWDPMTKAFKVGDQVSWNSEAGRVRGTIVKVHTKDVNYKGYIHHASRGDHQYEIKSDKTDHVAIHKGTALRRLD